MSNTAPGKYRKLWQDIEAFTLDNPTADYTFSDRLARENEWTPAYAQRVIQEYKRFIFLACAAPHPVTPAVDVDQAWHLHLTYTRSYWEQLCGQVVKRALHHGPTAGGQAESHKFHDWYNRTVAKTTH